jgi:hypothetical protein
MKFSLSFILLAALVLSACTDYENQPPQKVRHPVGRYSAEGSAPVAAGTQQPFNPNAPPPENNAGNENASPPPPPAPPTSTKVTKGDFPYGIPVPGKPHLVESPYSPGKYIDVEGFGPGQEVKDPYTGKIFLVP